MGGGGGKGGSNESTNEIKLPKEITEAAKTNLKVADEVAAIGYVPYRGNTMAALTPMQKAAMDSTSGALGAFGMGGGQRHMQPGMDPYTGMMMRPTNRGGVMGYSPEGIYEDAKGRIPEAQRRMIDSFTMNPETGARALNPVIPGQKYDPMGLGAAGGFQADPTGGAGGAGKGGADDGTMKTWATKDGLPYIQSKSNPLGNFNFGNSGGGK